MLDAHQMNVFLTAAQTLNFSEAGRRLHMTQPSVSQHIQTLERHFNTQLFVRSGRHLSLSEAGEALLPLAREFISLSVQIEESMASLQGYVHGHLQFGCSTTAGKYILPKLLAGFRDIHPHVQITCHVRDNATAIQMLIEGKVNLALAHERVNFRDVEFRKFMDDPVVLAVYPDHPWASRSVLQPEELLEGDFILREEGAGSRTELAKGLPEIGLSLDQLRTVMVLGNSEAISLAVQEGIGVSFLSRLVVRAPASRGELVAVEIEGLHLAQEIWIGRNLHQAATRAQAAFWSFVHDPNNQLAHSLVSGVSTA